MKIFHCLNHFLPQHIAGTEVYVLALCKGQQKRNHAVRVVIPNYNNIQEELYDYEGISVFKYPEPSVPDRALITGQRVPEGLKNFETYIKEERPDIVHFHEIAGSNGITIGHLEAAKAAGTKVIFTMHLATATCRAGTLMLETKKLCDGLILENRCAYCTLIHKTDSIVKSSVLTKTGTILSALGVSSIKWQNSIGTALSYPYQIKKLKIDLKRIAASCDKMISLTAWYYKILVLNGVSAEKLNIIRQALTSVPVSPKNYKNKGLPVRLIFVGRIDPLKGIRLLVDVIKKFTPDQLEIDIYGNVIDADFYHKCKEETFSCKHIRWNGRLKMEQVVRVMSGYSALILPSMFSEMSPLVVQEAFAAGIPVIGSNVYGIAEHVQDGVNGLLFQFGNALSLQQTLHTQANASKF